MNVIEALHHRELFGRVKPFRDLSSWRAWIVALKSLSGLPLNNDEMDIFTRCTGREEPLAEEASEAAFIIGRRGGKSQVAGLRACDMALLRDWRAYLAPGELATVALICQSTRAAMRTLFGYVKGIVRNVPAFAREVTEERADEFVFGRRQTAIAVWPSTFRSPRGLTLAAAILDEADVFWQGDSPNAAAEVVAACLPALSSLPGSQLLVLSSPYSVVGWLHDYHEAYFGQPGPRLIWQAGSRVMNPRLSEERIAAMIATDPERLGPEFEATWRAGLSAAFNPVDIDACTRVEPLILPPPVGVVR